MVESWLLFSLSTVLIWGFTVIVDKIVLSRYLGAFSYFFAYIPAGLVLVAAILLLFPISFDPFAFFLAAFAGAVAVIGFYAYAYAMKREEASRISPLTSLYPAFVAVFAALIVNETFSIRTYAGIFVMIVGAVLISYKKGKSRRIISVAVILAILATNILYGLEQTISKASMHFYDFWPFFAIYLLGRSAMAIPSLAVPGIRKKIFSEFSKLKWKISLLIVGFSAIWILGLVFFFFAISLGPVTLVSTISIMSPLATLALAIVIEKFRPRLLKEEIDMGTVSLKFLAIVIIIFGTYLIVA